MKQNKQKMQNKISTQDRQNKFTKGFTLIELLVVVLIIGILAAIALPRYKIAVGKTKLTALKQKAKIIADAEELYYTQNGQYTSNVEELQINFNGSENSGNSFIFSDGSSCIIKSTESHKNVKCQISLGNDLIAYFQHFLHSSKIHKRTCGVTSTDTSSIVHKICQNDTRKTEADACLNNSCNYYY